MPPTNTTADRVMMRLAEAAEEVVLSWKADPNLPPSQMKRMIAAALSSHGLRELVKVSQMLKPIEDLIEGIDNRCSAADGPVTETEREITQAELRDLLMLAWAAATEARITLTALLGELPTVKGEK